MNSIQCKTLMSAALLGTLAGFSPAYGGPILGSDLASFTVLGSSEVTNVPTSTITGNVGVWPGSAITGFDSSSGDAVSDPQVTSGLVHSSTALAESAQGQLTTAINNLSSLGGGTTLSLADLAGLTLTPGVYTLPAGTTNLSGTVTLDGEDNANAAWVFQMPSTLITSPNSVVNMINAGSGAGLFWNVGSSATIDVNSTFLGNILASESISMNTTATDVCGRALASNGAVTLQQNSLSGICTGMLAGSDGLSGGLDVSSDGSGVTILPSSTIATVPLPSPLILMGLGLAGLVLRRRRHG
ncbi:MAG: DUF3494 domain-containing protein [Pseudohongiellaceae bacterium]